MRQYHQSLISALTCLILLCARTDGEAQTTNAANAFGSFSAATGAHTVTAQDIADQDAIDRYYWTWDSTYQKDLLSAQIAAKASHQPIFVLVRGSRTSPWANDSSAFMKQVIGQASPRREILGDFVMLKYILSPGKTPLPNRLMAEYRKINNGAPEGAQQKTLPYVIVLTPDGRYVGETPAYKEDDGYQGILSSLRELRDKARAAP